MKNTLLERAPKKNGHAQQTMKAAVVEQFGQPLSIKELPVPEPGPGQVLIRLVATGVCHTDLHAADGDWPVKPTPPFIPGHEGAGYVVRVGAGVTHLQAGDRVGVVWLHSACGLCDQCLRGWETLCPHQQNSGYSVNGSFAEYVVAAAAYVGRLPDKISYADIAPVLCAGVTTYKGLKETEARPGDWVAIVGIGGLGHMAVQYARAMGLHVAAIDVGEDKLALARELGAELTIDARDGDPVATIQKELGGVHGALVTAVARTPFSQAVGMLRRGGTCALVGLPPTDMTLPIFDMVLNRLTVRGSIVGTRLDLKEALQFAADGLVKVHYQVEPLEAINDVFDRLKRGAITGRIVLQISPEPA